MRFSISLGIGLFVACTNTWSAELESLRLFYSPMQRQLQSARMMAQVGLRTKPSTEFGAAEPVGLPTGIKSKTRINSQTNFPSNLQSSKPITSLTRTQQKPETTTTVESLPKQRYRIVRYSGFLQSASGMQLFVNGVPWRADLRTNFSVSERNNGQAIDITSVKGNVFRLYLGEEMAVPVQ